jgi:hypothetical protein
MEATEHVIVREIPDVVTQVVYQLRLRNDETNVVGKEKEDGGENGCAKAVNVGVDVWLWDDDAFHDGVGGGSVVCERVVRGIGCLSYCHGGAQGG